MPRGPRNIIPGYWYHLTHRGNNKQQIFFNVEDYQRYLYYFEKVRKENGVKILAYCLMNNHVHFIACEENGGSISRTIKLVHGEYAKYVHSKFDSVGHIWQGRFYSCLLDQPHLYLAMRYVERNPVRAKLVNLPWEWVWSSARTHVSADKGIVSIIDYTKYIEVESWIDFLTIHDNENDLYEIRKQTNSLKSWGSDDFKKEIEEKFHINMFSKKKGRPQKQKLVYVPIL